MPQITQPTLLLDEQKCRRNIESMAGKARRSHVQFRPHFKTHQSHEIGRWFRDSGVEKITVSSLKMADYFARDGWNDITVAFAVNILEIETINSLAKRIRLNLLVESAESVRSLNSGLSHHVDLFVKIDAGYHRTGIAYDNMAMIDSVLTSIDQSPNLSFAGFLTHSGHSYNARSSSEIVTIHNESINRIKVLKKRYAGRYPGLIVSVGDTPTCSVVDDFSSVDEIRPGNFVFYDLMQLQIGACRADQVAIAMACPVVAVHKDRNELIIYGGAVHFSKEGLQEEGAGTIFGCAVETLPHGWGEPIKGIYLKRLSQEHGIVHLPDEFLDRYATGDVITILPVHSCLTADCVKSYLTLSGKHIDRFI